MDIYAKSNVGYTEEHVNVLYDLGVNNLVEAMKSMNFVKFPTKKDIEKSEKQINLLYKFKNNKHG